MTISKFQQLKQVIEINTAKGKKIVSTASIIFVKANKKGSVISINDQGLIETGHLLKWYKNFLLEPVFFRCHNSFIVNCLFVDCFCNKEVILSEHIRIPLSRKRIPDFRKNLIELKKEL